MNEKRRRQARPKGVSRAAGLETRVVHVALGATVSALTAAFAIYQFSNWSSDRQDLAQDTLTLARSLSGVAHAAAVSGDREAAADAAILMLSAKNVTEAAYFPVGGERFGIARDGQDLPPLQPLGVTAPTVLYRAPGVEVHVPRRDRGRRVGEMVMRASDAELVAGRLRNVLLALGLSLCATLAAAMMSRRLARRALRPLKRLNGAVEELTASRDFTRRVTVTSHDEVGQLTRNYNRLVDALQRYDGELRRALTDVTAARDAAEEANVLKSQFLANMGHEIRTPLNGVLGMAQALMLEELSEGQRERVEVIRQSGAALLCVLNDVLDLSELESGRLQLEESAFDLETVVRDASAVAATLAESKGVAFGFEVDPAAAGAWQGDPVRLRQVLYNLISNALKFTAEGSVQVGAACAPSGDGLLLTVADTGVGISAEVAPKLFGKFVQGEAGATRRFGGAGVGLAICRSLVEMMGGEIEVESAEGTGSTFRVWLPLRRAEAADDPAEASGDVCRLKVLVAEDNETNQRVVRTVLGALGVEHAEIVPDGEAAVQAWSRGGFDLVLMDIQMPVRDGVSATREIRRLEAERGLPHTRIVALTANALPHQAAEYAAAGMDGLVPKPILIEKLHAALLGYGAGLGAAESQAA